MNFKSRFTVPLIATLLLFVLAACGGGDTETDSPTATAVQDSPASTPPASPTAGKPELEIAEAPGEDESFTKPTPPGGIVPTAPPPMESSFDSDGNGFMSKAEFRTALDATIGDYEWPDGYLYSVEKAHALSTDPVPDHAEFENGSEHGAIGGAHMCAWAETWLGAFNNGDYALQEQAMTQLTEVSLNNPMFTYITEHLEEIFQLAQLGDIAPLQNYVDINCSWNAYDSTPEAKYSPDSANTLTARSPIIERSYVLAASFA